MLAHPGMGHSILEYIWDRLKIEPRHGSWAQKRQNISMQGEIIKTADSRLKN